MGKGGSPVCAAVADAGADSDNLNIKGITRAVLDVCCMKQQGVSTDDQLVCRNTTASPVSRRYRFRHAQAAAMLPTA